MKLMIEKITTIIIAIICIIYLVSASYADNPKCLGTPFTDISAENTFTTAVTIYGNYNISVEGDSWSATVTIQRSFDKGTTWYDVQSFTENTEKMGFEPCNSDCGVMYRIGVKTGDYSSGTVQVRIKQ